jgi:twinkle protein
MEESLQLSEAHARWLEDKRKIPCELAAQYVVSKGGNPAFLYVRNGQLSYLKIRKDVPNAKPDYCIDWIGPKGELSLFNEDCLKDPSDTLIITEGEIDALSFLAAGMQHVVSVPNGSPSDKPGEGDVNPLEDTAYRYLWEHNGKLKQGLERFKKIILATDADQKGLVLRDELAVRLGRPRCWYVTYPKGCKDANEVLVAHGIEALQNLIGDGKPIVPNRLVSFSEIPTRADDKRYPAGWGPTFDQHFMIVPPQLVLVMGKPNHGKSEWVVGLGANLARLHGLKGAMLQFEDDPDRIRRALFRYAKAWSGPQRQGRGIEEEPEAWIDRMFRVISPNEELREENDFDLRWLENTVEEAATRHGCRWVLIDPWNEVEHLWPRQETETTYLNRALKHIKRLARRLQIAIIIVAHPTKEGGRVESIKDASLYDINGGAAWNNKADLGVIVWADNVLRPERSLKIAKSRNFIRYGRPGIVQMRFDAACSIYTVVPND